MRPPEFTGGNIFTASIRVRDQSPASMRPPEFTGGNPLEIVGVAEDVAASMRPPEFTGGNVLSVAELEPHRLTTLQ